MWWNLIFVMYIDNAVACLWAEMTCYNGLSDIVPQIASVLMLTQYEVTLINNNCNIIDYI